MAVAQGLFEGSSTARVRLSLLLSRILFGSPRTARALFNPEDPPLELDESAATVLEPALEVSNGGGAAGDFAFARDGVSSSTQSAGVGGTGPRLDMGARLEEWPGRRVGGETMRSPPERSVDAERFALWDRDCGGGFGGGGGSGMPGSHLDLDADEARERELVGVSMAPVDAALREAGGLDSTCGSS